MAVKYDVIFKDGRRLNREAVCFGSMASAQWQLSGPQDLNTIDPSNQAMIQFYTANNLHPIWSEPDYTKFCRDWSGNSSISGSLRRDTNRAFLTEMKLLLDDLPWLHDVLTIHPLTGVVRAHLKDHPADKIITSLFIIRNLGNYGEIASCYRHFRQQGFRPRFCAIMAHYLNKNHGAMGRCSFHRQRLGEYNWINPQTFGKNGFLRMMGADENTEFDFIQRPWTVQRGYRRDMHYKIGIPSRGGRRLDPEITYNVDNNNPEAGMWLPFDTRYIMADGWDEERQTPTHEYRTSVGSASYLYTRNLVDCYSIPGDEPIGWMSWNPVSGMSIGEFGLNQLTLEQVNEFVASVEAVCMEAGISIRE